VSASRRKPICPLENRAERVIYIDVAKGISISLVVFFHTIHGFVTLGLIDYSSVLSFANTIAWGSSVQIFFVIAGYFSAKSLGRIDILEQRMLGLYYPYLFWSVVSFFASNAAANMTNSHYSWYSLAAIPVWPILHYWFLLSLMVAICLLHVFRSLLSLIASATIALVASSFLPGWLHDTAYFYTFAVVGALIALNGSLPILRPRAALICVALLIFGVCLATITSSDFRTAPFVFFSLAGCYSLAFLSKAIAPTWIGRLFAYFGENSLAIYLLHVLIAASLRTFFCKAYPFSNPTASMVICFVAAMGASLLAREIAYQLGLLKFVGFEPILKHSRVSSLARTSATGLLS
jgi:fucose 4-O-acetylase-like acetyltransferase